MVGDILYELDSSEKAVALQMDPVSMVSKLKPKLQLHMHNEDVIYRNTSELLKKEFLSDL
jgi:hypothetical protein